MPPLVSVLVPVFNARPYLREALESLVAQTYPHWEAVVVDDGSTDASAAVVGELGARDARIRLHGREHEGVAAARNAALALARGELVAFLDADDAWLPEKLERQVAAWREGVLYSDAYLTAADGTPAGRIGDGVEFVRGQVFDALLERNVVATTTAILPRELVEAVGGFDAALERCEDYDLWLRLADAGAPFDLVERPLALRRLHGGQMTGDLVANATELVTMLERLAGRVTPGRRAQVERRAAALRRDAAGALRRRAWEETAAGRPDLARADLRSAQATAPSLAGGVATALAVRSTTVLRLLARWRGPEPG